MKPRDLICIAVFWFRIPTRFHQSAPSRKPAMVNDAKIRHKTEGTTGNRPRTGRRKCRNHSEGRKQNIENGAQDIDTTPMVVANEAYRRRGYHPPSAAAPPRRVMSSRRLMGFPLTPGQHPIKTNTVLHRSNIAAPMVVPGQSYLAGAGEMSPFANSGLPVRRKGPLTDQRRETPGGEAKK